MKLRSIEEVTSAIRAAMQQVLTQAQSTAYVSQFDDILERAVRALVPMTEQEKVETSRRRVVFIGRTNEGTDLENVRAPYPSHPDSALLDAGFDLVEALSACGVRVKSMNGVHEKELREALERFKKALGATE